MDNIIKLLPPKIANKIAAGEVVDRPVSVVKELIENSLDAGATSIIIEIKNGGKSFIRVTDNGSGIKSDFIKIAFLRHATSKISEVEDLDKISTLGFRGEALASISAVSRTELTSRTADEDIGFKVTYHGSSLVEESPFGCPAGTTIIVKDLFYNTPARLKFLKQDNTESALIIDLVSKVALGYPNVKIRLINNGNILFSTTGKGDIYNNILTIYDSSSGKNLIYFEKENDNIRVEGFVSPPDESRKNRKGQVFFVNGRVVSSKLIEEALEKAYDEKLFEGRYPVAYIFIEVNPSMLDVNIHPNKKEVRFSNPSDIKELITSSVFNAINNVNAIPSMMKNDQNQFSDFDPDILEHSLYNSLKNSEGSFKFSDFEVDSKLQDTSQEELDINKILIEKRMMENREKEDKVKEVSHTYEQDKKENERNNFKISSLKIIGTLFNTYILCQDSNNLYLIDQHAAHERVFYEQFMKVYENENREIQTLLHPFVVNVSFQAINSSSEWFDMITKCGFIMEEFGDRAFIVKGIPLFMEYGEGKRFLEDILQSLDEGIDLKNSIKIDKLITRSCKSAVKAHDILSDMEIKRLLEDLDKCIKPYSCPHGRPTFIKFSEYDIEKMFKRVI